MDCQPPCQHCDATKAEEYREKAKRIADRVLEDMTGTESLHWIAATAAYAALAEMESAR